MKPTQQSKDPLFISHYPLQLLGAQLGRNVTIFRLSSGSLVIHSTAPFTEEDKIEIKKLGEVAAIVDVTKFHDTFAKIGISAFPDVPYFAPVGFPQKEKLNPRNIEEGKEIWGDELIWIPLEGVPSLNEWACFHPVSKTLVVADLVFNCKPFDFRGKLFFTLAGIRGWPGNCRLFRLCIRDRKKFEKSIRRVLSFEFERVVVAHGRPIEKGAKAVFRSAIERAFPWMKLDRTSRSTQCR